LDRVGFENSGSFPKKELEWHWTTSGPCSLVVPCFGKGELKELGARPVPFPDQAVSHAARCFVVVAGPAAIEVNLNFPLWVRKNSIEQIAPIRKCASRARVPRRPRCQESVSKTSALDLNCKAHELDNLYVVDASFFCSSGAVNPALTIIANALRVGDHLLGRIGARRAKPEMMATA
jgi:GMC oxidoreductase